MGIQVWESREVLRDVPDQEIPAEIVQTDIVVPRVLPGAVSIEPESGSLPVVSESQAGNAPVENAQADEEPPLPTDDFMPGLDISEVSSQAASTIDVHSLDWPALQTAVASCKACELHKTRTQTVFGVGDHTAQWMIIGEAPGADEDQQGEPFVGRAGQLLNNMLKALGLQREQVFIANILKCRPPGNRNPQPEEIVQCEAFLQRQVALVKPKVILAVGGVAAHNLLKVTTAVSKLRGQLHHYGETPLVVTYHPAYLLRKPGEKARSWTDLKFAAAVVRGEQS
ncbi:MAG: uracil-DNA glycosylase [Gammaproteobacteria bacterium]|nr:uracil-DNA glycosylase [Gammaproteobacteria bacterium]